MHPNGYDCAVDFEFKPDDVLVCSGPKCGTTWMLQIVHSLRSHGNMDFEEIDEVAPILEFGKDPLFPRLDTPQPFPSRLFMTHLPYSLTPKVPCKQIIVTR